jgi:hypothetical protein
LLQALKKQLLWLKLGNKKLSSALLSELVDLTNLTRLYLDRTGVTDDGLKFLEDLRELQYINLVGNSVTGKGLEHLKELKSLRHIYIYQTGIQSSEFEGVKKLFPNTTIDTGGYKVPILTGDTTEVKEPPKK